MYGEQNLFDMKNKVARNRFLIISYSTESRIVEELTKNPAIFLVNGGQKLEETEREGLQLDWQKKPSAATVISLLNLVIIITVILVNSMKQGSLRAISPDAKVARAIYQLN